MESILNFFRECLSRGDFIELFAANKKKTYISPDFSMFTFLYKITLKHKVGFLKKFFQNFLLFFLWQIQISGPFLFQKVSAKINPVFYSRKDNFICLTYA